MACKEPEHIQGDRGKPTQVFGLTPAELWPFVENMAGEPVETFDVAIADPLRGQRGYSARKLTPTFRYTAKSGRSGSQTAFVKWFETPGPREAHHCEQLAAIGAPIPRMYGARADAEGREMLFLEYLQQIDDIPPFDRFVRDTGQFRLFLSIAARFCALRPPPEYAARLRRFDHEQIEHRLHAATQLMAEVCRAGQAGQLGKSMASFCQANADRLPEVSSLATTALARLRSMELSFAHGDFYPDSVAVRPETGEMLMVDLEGVGYFPRFWDVARWLGPAIEVGIPGCPRQDLGAFYLSEHSRWGGAPTAITDFPAQVEVLATASGLMMVPFAFRRALDGQVDWTDDRDEGRRAYRLNLQRVLEGLMGACQ